MPIDPRGLFVLLSCSLALLAPVGAARAVGDPFAPSDPDERAAIEAISLYPEEIRQRVLEASTEADVLGDIEALQQRSQQAFQDLLAPYPQEVQQDLFDLSRHPDLVAEIAALPPQDDSGLRELARRYPEEMEAPLLRQGRERHRVIVRMNELLAQTDQRFEQRLADLPPHKADAFRRLLAVPEVMSLLAANAELTILIGDAYDRDPDGTRDRFDQLSLEVARANAEEADDWNRSLADDPDLQRDFDQAAQDYQRSTGYSPYAPPRTTVQVVITPYPYWVGYPAWYPVRYAYYDPGYWWYPSSSWIYFGWNFGPRFYFAFGSQPHWRYGYPTPYFTSWYFSHGHHHAHYPHLSLHYVDHYYHHPRHRRHHHYNRHCVDRFVHEAHSVGGRDFEHGRREDRIASIADYGRRSREFEPRLIEHRREESRHGDRDRRERRLRDPASGAYDREELARRGTWDTGEEHAERRREDRTGRNDTERRSQRGAQAEVDPRSGRRGQEPQDSANDQAIPRDGLQRREESSTRPGHSRPAALGLPAAEPTDSDAAPGLREGLPRNERRLRTAPGGTFNPIDSNGPESGEAAATPASPSERRVRRERSSDTQRWTPQAPRRAGASPDDRVGSAPESATGAAGPASEPGGSELRERRETRRPEIEPSGAERRETRRRRDMRTEGTLSGNAPGLDEIAPGSSRGSTSGGVRERSSGAHSREGARWNHRGTASRTPSRRAPSGGAPLLEP